MIDLYHTLLHCIIRFYSVICQFVGFPGDKCTEWYFNCDSCNVTHNDVPITFLIHPQIFRGVMIKSITVVMMVVRLILEHITIGASTMWKQH